MKDATAYQGTTEKLQRWMGYSLLFCLALVGLANSPLMPAHIEAVNVTLNEYLQTTTRQDWALAVESELKVKSIGFTQQPLAETSSDATGNKQAPQVIRIEQPWRVSAATLRVTNQSVTL